MGELNPDQYIMTTKESINFVGLMYNKYMAEFTQAVRDLQLVNSVAPVNPDPDDVIAFKLWKLSINRHRVKEQEYANFWAGSYNVVLGQCSEEALQDKLKSHAGFPNAYQNGIELLRIIKTITCTFEVRQKQADAALLDIKNIFCSFKQGRSMSLQRHHKLFLSHVEVLAKVGIMIADQSLVDTIAADNGRPNAANNADQQAAHKWALATRLFWGTNTNYSRYLTHLCNGFLDGNDNYPDTLHKAYNILQCRKRENWPTVPESEGVSFVNNG